MMESEAKTDLTGGPYAKLTASLAAAGLILSNLSSVLKGLEDVASDLGVTSRSLVVPSRAWWLVLILLAGDAIVILSIYRFALRKFPDRVPVVLIVGVSLAAVIFITNFVILPENVALLPDKTTSRLVNQLAKTQFTNSNREVQGFQIFLSGVPASEDPWSTSQALTAIELGSSDLNRFRERLRAGFRFLDGAKVSQPVPGWTQNVGTNPTPRTDIEGWVAIANIESLSTDKIWNREELQSRTDLTIAILDDIAAAQDVVTGAWGPTHRTNVQNDRTYPTIIALWSLLESYRNARLSEVARGRYDTAINRGIMWLLNNYHEHGGWYPDPAILADTCEGLSSQAVMVLAIAANLGRDINNLDISTSPTYRRVVEQFTERKVDTKVAAHPCRPADKIFEEEHEVFFVSFDDFPWTLAAARALTKDPSLGWAQKRRLAQMQNELLGAASGLKNGFPDDAMTFQLAETVTGLFYGFDSQSNGVFGSFFTK